MCKNPKSGSWSRTACPSETCVIGVWRGRSADGILRGAGVVVSQP